MCVFALKSKQQVGEKKPLNDIKGIKPTDQETQTSDGNNFLPDPATVCWHQASRAWQGSHWSARFLSHWYDSTLKNQSALSGDQTQIFRSRGARLNH